MLGSEPSGAGSRQVERRLDWRPRRVVFWVMVIEASRPLSVDADVCN